MDSLKLELPLYLEIATPKTSEMALEEERGGNTSKVGGWAPPSALSEQQSFYC